MMKNENEKVLNLNQLKYTQEQLESAFSKEKDGPMNPMLMYKYISSEDKSQKIKKNIKIMEKSNEKVKQIQLKEIEYKIREKYNMLIPAILVELKDCKKMEQEKEYIEMENFMSSLGEVQRMCFTSETCYVLYENYFSASLAYELFKKKIIDNEEKCIAIRYMKRNENYKFDFDFASQFSFEAERNIYNYNNVIKQSKRIYNVEEFEKAEKYYNELFNINKEKEIAQNNNNIQQNYFPQQNQNQAPKQNPVSYKSNSNNCQEITYIIMPDGMDKSLADKFICNYEVQIPNDDDFKITKILIGNKGDLFTQILKCAGAGESDKIRLRGKGSGFKEGVNCQESDDGLQLCISSKNHGIFGFLCRAVDSILIQIYSRYKNFIEDFNSKRENLKKKDLDLVPISIKKKEVYKIKN